MDDTPMENTIGYGAAMRELEEILEEIDDEAVDIDDLSLKVRRAAELIEICRDKIRRTRIEVENVVADLEWDDTPEPVPAADPDRSEQT